MGTGLIVEGRILDPSIASGPVDVAISRCSDAHVAWLSQARRIFVVAEGTTNGSIAGDVWDENLTPITPPALLAPSAHWGRVVDDGDGAEPNLRRHAAVPLGRDLAATRMVRDQAHADPA